MLFLDGVYVIGEEGLVFRRVRPPIRRSLEHLVQTIGQRVGAYLERRGLLVRDIENTYLALESTDVSTMDDLLGHSISYRIAVGPHADRKAFKRTNDESWNGCAYAEVCITGTAAPACTAGEPGRRYRPNAWP